MPLPIQSVNILLRCPLGRTLLQMRDGAARRSPLQWSFWGGALEAGDRDSLAAAAREVGEELGLITSADAFELIGERRSSTQIAHLVLYRADVTWRDIDVREGAGAGFFWHDEMAQLPLAHVVRYHLQAHEEFFLKRPVIHCG